MKNVSFFFITVHFSWSVLKQEIMTSQITFFFVVFRFILQTHWHITSDLLAYRLRDPVKNHN